jgi:hypothetical protein
MKVNSLVGKNIILALVFGLMVPGLVAADYYISDYDPDYVPYNLQEVIDVDDNYYSCQDELREFDALYQEYLSLYGTPVSVGDTLDIHFGALKEAAEEDFRQCLAQVRVEKQEESIENCDFEVIASLNRDEERLYKDEIKLCEDTRALEACDFSYIEEMDGSDKFKYRNEIDVCEVEMMEDEEIIQEESEPVVLEQISEPVVTPDPIPETISEPQPSVPQYTPPPVTVAPVTNIVAEESPVSTQNDEEAAVDPSENLESELEEESETVEMTEEELEQLIQKRIEEATGETEAEQVPESQPEKRSFFRKVWDFLFGWW